MNNAERAVRLEIAMLALREEYRDDACEWLVDLLTDARHWCDSNNRSFAELDGQAHRHYLAELDEEA
jgi:hypothetical protein